MTAILDTIDICPQLTRLASTLSGVISIYAVEPATVKEIQKILKNVTTSDRPTGYYTGDIDGVSGKLTAAALAAFKHDHWLEYPEQIGRSTVLALLEVARGNHPVSEQPSGLNQQPLPPEKLGKRSGATMRLPDGVVVYEHEFISPGCYLTWGEFTKGCTRPLEERYQIANAIAYSKVFAWVREKWGSPLGMTSGFRPPAVNNDPSVGGARNSQHLYATAGDIYPIEGDLYDLLAIIKVSPFTAIGLGMCKGFIHTDIRKSATASDKIVFGYGC